jgi:hypothetical protein
MSDTASPGRSHPNVQTPDNSEALATFIARKSEIDTILARLAALSAGHFDLVPDEITWADVGTLSSYLKELREVSDNAFHESEHKGEYAV